ncbi:MAG: gamma-glutamyltransferase [Bdellovibrionales bacterium]
MKNILICIALLFFYTQSFSAPFEGRNLVISATSVDGVKAAKKIYQKGGNVIDAAVTLGLVMSVTHPYFASLGGGGFAQVRMNGKVETLDFREMAPGKTHEKFYADKKNNSRRGGSAVGTPGMLAGYWEMHQKYGKLPWKDVVAPAIQVAEKGFQINHDWPKRIDMAMDYLDSVGKEILFPKNKKQDPGEVLTQKKYAYALRLIQKYGPKPFYQGAIAKDIVAAVKKSGGVLSMDDLASYKVKWRVPLKKEFKGYTFYLMPPPSSGGVVIATALDLIEKRDVFKYDNFADLEIHLLIEIMKRSFRGRGLLGDPDFYENPVEKLLSEKYINQLNRSIRFSKVNPIAPIDEAKFLPQKESTETTHFSIADKDGNAVSATITMNGVFGSGVFSNKFGINLNNEMDDFTTQPGKPNMFGLIQGSGNKVEPNKRPLSSMTPTIVEKEGDLRLVIGAPGGPMIISAILQVAYRNLFKDLNIDEAVQAPRFHHQFLPDKVIYDKNKVFPTTLKVLERKGHKLSTGWAARVYAVSKEGNVLTGAHDNRLPGHTDGY